MSKTTSTSNAAGTARTARKVIFNASEVARRLATLRNDAINNGQEDTAWWRPAFSIDWTNPRKGNNGTQWVNVTFTDANGVNGRLVVRINGERHVGQIMPASDAGVAELAARSTNPNSKIEKRTRKPTVQIQKWGAYVKTEDDGITVLTGDDGQPLYPDESLLSPYYELTYYVNEAFSFEAKERVERGMTLLAKATELKRADKSVTAKTVVESFLAVNGPRRPADMILSSESVRKLFPTQKDADLLTKGAIIASNAKIVSLVQEYNSDRATKNSGLPLPNPMTRITMEFDGVTGVARTAFFDKTAPYIADGKQKYEVGKVDGDPVNADNVHIFMQSRALVDGIVEFSCCISSMGISMPVKAEVLVVDKPSDYGVSLDDVYDDAATGAVATGAVATGAVATGAVGAGAAATGAVGAGAAATGAAATGAVGAGAAGAGAAATGAVAEEENYDELLGELGATAPITASTGK